MKYPGVEIFHHVAFRQLEFLISMSALGHKRTWIGGFSPYSVPVEPLKCLGDRQ